MALALKLATIGMTLPWMASSVAVASHRVPLGW
ncbi:Uncharacterised protein [Mycobacteroides abscessus subsp. abscessus]|nr:Uncharacterised protein [Mycobacteroides abscessus subsp. abscessus]